MTPDPPQEARHPHTPTPPGAEIGVSHLAGSDTREAAKTLTVRLLAGAAFAVSIPGWAAVFSAWNVGEQFLRLRPDWSSMSVVILAVTGLLGGLAGSRSKSQAKENGPSLENLPPGAGPLILMAALAIVTLGSGSTGFASASLFVFPAAAGYFLARVAGMAAFSCVEGVRAAAIGMVTLGGVAGVTLAGPLNSVTDGSGFAWGSSWTLICLAVGGIYLGRAQSTLGRDRRRVKARESSFSEPKGDAVFVCERIACGFAANKVLQDVGLRVLAGEFVALVGANGAGKSTLLRAAAGYIEVDDGRFMIGGHDATMLMPEERAAMGLSFVSGARPIFPDLTVMENLRVAALNAGVPARSFVTSTQAIMDLVPAIATRRRSKAGVLSGGEQRLLAVAQTLYQQPIALLADELSLGLDSQARVAVLDLLRMLADDGVAVVAVDHDLACLLPRSDRAVLLKAGTVEHYDDPVSLLDQRSTVLPATFLAEVPN